MKDYQQRRKEELQKTEGRTDKRHRQDKTEKLERKCTKITEFKGTGLYDSMHKKAKKLDWKESRGIQNTDIVDSQENIIVDQRQVQKIWENYMTELYNRPKRP